MQVSDSALARSRHGRQDQIRLRSALIKILILWDMYTLTTFTSSQWGHTELYTAGCGWSMDAHMEFILIPFDYV